MLKTENENDTCIDETIARIDTAPDFHTITLHEILMYIPHLLIVTNHDGYPQIAWEREIPTFVTPLGTVKEQGVPAELKLPRNLSGSQQVLVSKKKFLSSKMKRNCVDDH